LGACDVEDIASYLTGASRLLLDLHNFNLDFLLVSREMSLRYDYEEKEDAIHTEPTPMQRNEDERETIWRDPRT
jgi:hypothetical protein